MLSETKHSKHHQHLANMPKLPLAIENVRTLYRSADFRTELLSLIASATKRIYLVALYLEQDDAGRAVLNALYEAKKARPELEINVLVDWHRAQRGRIGEKSSNSNADWYTRTAQENPGIDVPVYGVPVNTREALGVLHLKGFIIDDTVSYSGASINDVYLHQHDKYRYDRYQLLTQPQLADTMVNYIANNLMTSNAVFRLDSADRPKTINIKPKIKQFRQRLRHFHYQVAALANNDELAATPLVGLGKSSPLNTTIAHLMCSTQKKLTICTPYFNLPPLLVRHISHLLRQGKEVEIIVGDKTANDFYIPEDQPFNIVGALPYLYEINLRHFVSRFQRYVSNNQLTVRLWKDEDNTYHLKGMWVDDEWQLITGNNLNPRAWRLDLENAILIHDPKQQMQQQRQTELDNIRENTQVISHYEQLQLLADYPPKVKKLIKRLRRIRIDKIISRIL